MRKIWITWNQFDELVMNIIEHLRDDNFKPELVVGIARGGLPLMITIASYFGIREVGVMFVQKTITDEFFSERLTSPVLHGIGLPFGVRNKNVLLVDDIIRSGQSIKTSLGAITELGSNSIKVVTLYKQPDVYDFESYSPAEVRDDDWVVFPWSRLKFCEG